MIDFELLLVTVQPRASSSPSLGLIPGTGGLAFNISVSAQRQVLTVPWREESGGKTGFVLAPYRQGWTPPRTTRNFCSM